MTNANQRDLSGQDRPLGDLEGTERDTYPDDAEEIVDRADDEDDFDEDEEEDEDSVDVTGHDEPD